MNCQKFDSILYLNACIWHELVDLTFCGQSTNWHRYVTKWTQACDRRLARLISYIHFTSDYRQYCHVGNAAQQCRLLLFQDSDFAGYLEDINIRRSFVHFLEVKHLYQSVGCARSKRQYLTAPQNQKSYRWMLVCVWTVYLRLTFGIWTLKCWERLQEYQYQPKHAHGKPVLRPKSRPRWNKYWIRMSICRTWIKLLRTHNSLRKNHSYIFEDNEAAKEMIIKDRSPTMRLVSRTHRVALNWLFDRINFDPKVQIKYVESKNQIADILTKGSFTRDDWHNLLHLLSIMNDTTFSCSHFHSHSSLSAGKQSEMSKRSQESSSLGSMVKAKACCLVSRQWILHVPQVLSIGGSFGFLTRQAFLFNTCFLEDLRR